MDKVPRVANRFLVRKVWIFISLLGGPLSLSWAGSLTPTFERDVEPILTRAGCNAGACHGKARGQNGFALSLLGFDPQFDHDAIAREARGRRVFPASPEDSMLLRKATAVIPHGGGRRIEPKSQFHKTLQEWIANGMPRTPSDAPRLVRLTVEPALKTVQRGEVFPLKVTARFTDNKDVDVTHLSAFGSSDPTIVSVDVDGKVKAGPIPGEAAISARYEGVFANCDVTIPLPGTVSAQYYESLPRSNFIDELVYAKLQKLGLTASPACDDATFLRRASLDIIGRVPKPEEVRAYLADNRPDRRTRLVDDLLRRPEYADYWASKWVDLLRPNPYRVGIKAVFNMDGWIRDAFRNNMPYDKFVRGLITARGSTFTNGAATFFRDRREPDEIAPVVSQLFLGIRLECAKCHHHPFESWGQEQFYEFAAFFARVGRKGTGLSPPISGDEEIIFLAKSGSVKHPLTGVVLPPKPLFGKVTINEGNDEDPREVLARWMISPDNPYFAQVIVNRVWADLMGVGIVEPVDDIRATNPASNGPLLTALAEDFRNHGYDLKQLIRQMATSAVYSHSSVPTERNSGDTRNFSRHYRQRLRAEVMLDAISDITLGNDRFDAAPADSRAVAIWTHRIPSLFLDTFGRPDPNQDPPCVRTADTSVVQSLHLMNAPAIQEKLSRGEGRVSQLVSGVKNPSAIVEELYLLAYGRFPTTAERESLLPMFSGPGVNLRLLVEDLLWAMLNSAEFVFKN